MSTGLEYNCVRHWMLSSPILKKLYNNGQDPIYWCKRKKFNITEK